MKIDTTLAGWIAAVSVAMFVVSLLSLPWLLARIPADYFLSSGRPQNSSRWRHPLLAWLWHVAKNLMGVVLFIAGCFMLITPGQGLLTLLAGLWLMDMPGKRNCELKLVRIPRVLAVINRLRRRANQPPLLVPTDDGHAE